MNRPTRATASLPRAQCSSRCAAAPRHAEVQRNTKETQIRVQRRPRRQRPRAACHRHRLFRPHARPGGAPRADRPRDRCQGRPAHRRPSHGRGRRHHAGHGGGARRSATRPASRRYGHAYVPLDEALSRVVIDFSGRPGLHMHVPFKAAHGRRLRHPAGLRVLPGLRQPRAGHAAHRQPARRQRAPPVRDRVQGVRARAAHGAGELDPRSAGVVPSTKGSL